MTKENLTQLRLQFLTNATERYDELDEVAMALDGGCRWIQLRMKDADDDKVIAVGSYGIQSFLQPPGTEEEPHVQV